MKTVFSRLVFFLWSRVSPLAIVAFGILFIFSGCQNHANQQIRQKTSQETTPPMQKADALETLRFQLKAMKRDLKILLKPLLKPLMHYPSSIENTLKYEIADAPFLQPRLVEALALKEDMQSEIRTPMGDLPRTYAQNPRRGESSVFHGEEAPVSTPSIWNAPKVKAWTHRHQFDTYFKTLWKEPPSLSTPMPESFWWQNVQALLPPEGVNAPLSIQRQAVENPNAVLAWRLARLVSYFPSDAIALKSKKALTRGKALHMGLYLAGLASQRIKTSEDAAYTEWWASPTADADARASLMRGWSHLNETEQHTLNMAYAMGMLDSVLSEPPPKDVKSLQRWSIDFHAPLTVEEGIRLLAWVDDRRHQVR